MSANDFSNCLARAVDYELDARELRCPMPLLKAKQALRDLAQGNILRVIATDAGSWRDFQAYAQLSGHKLLAAAQEEGIYCYLLQKSPLQESGQ